MFTAQYHAVPNLYCGFRHICYIPVLFIFIKESPFLTWKWVLSAAVLGLPVPLNLVVLTFFIQVNVPQFPAKSYWSDGESKIAIMQTVKMRFLCEKQFFVIKTSFSWNEKSAANQETLELINVCRTVPHFTVPYLWYSTVPCRTWTAVFVTFVIYSYFSFLSKKSSFM